MRAICVGAAMLALAQVAEAAPWKPANDGLETHSSGKIVVDPTSSATLYSLTGHGIFKSVDGSRSWKRLDAAQPATSPNALAAAGALAVDAGDSRRLYAGSGALLYASVDGGATWAPTARPPVPNSVHTIAISRSPRTIYVGSQSNGLAVSADDGATWKRPTEVDGIGNRYINAIVLDPDAPAVAYVGTHSGVYKSVDGGHLWTSTAFLRDTIQALVIAPGRPSTLYAGGVNGVYASRDGGASWRQVGNLPYVSSLAFIGGKKPLLVAGTQFMGLQASSDGGASWTILDGVLPKAMTLAITVGAATPTTLFVTRSDGTFVSRDGGSQWQPIATGLEVHGGVNAIGFDRKTRNVAYLAAGGLYKSTDGGNRWQMITNGAAAKASIATFAVAPSNARVVYVGNVDGVFRTSDGGRNWKNTTGNLVIDKVFGEPFHSLAVDGSNPNIVYAGVQRRAVYRSTDGGASWTNASGGLPSCNVFALIVDEKHSVYARTSSGDWRTDDGGKTWTSRAPAPDAWPLGRKVTVEVHGTFLRPADPVTVIPDGVAQRRSDPQHPTWPVTLQPIRWAGDSNVGLAVERGVYATRDGGATWHALVTGLDGDVIPHSIAVDPFDARHLLLGTLDGVLVSTTGGE